MVQSAASYAAAFDNGDLPTRPKRSAAIVACMDSRMDIFGLLGLAIGDAHVIRNAGGLATDDALRSLTISQRLLGTREVVILQHTSCGLLSVDEEQLATDIEADCGTRPPFEFGAFSDLEQSVRNAIRTVRECPFLVEVGSVRGFIYSVQSGDLTEVTA